ncbi:MAG: exo-alpha-sialidase, partial [Fibrobacter sp.]|nr:exo-alpha-sialidase [Fibrobacter sp.]
MRKRLTFLSILMTVSFLSSSVPAQTGYEWKNVVVGGGGFVDGFVFHPKVKGLMYARTDMGGAYRWNPPTNSWIPLTDWIGYVSDNYGILAIALDPNDGSKVYLLSGKYSNSWTSEWGYVLCSNDTGKTFTKTQLKLKNGGNLDGRGCGERLAVDPNLGSILFLAGSGWDFSKDGTFQARYRGSLWKSTDNGRSFDSLAAGPKGNGLFILFDPSSGTTGNATQTIYAGYDSSNGGAAALWRSKDGGATWAMVPGQPTGLIPTSGCINGQYAYFSFNNGIGPNGITKGQLMRLNTADDSWTDVSPVKNAAFGFGTPSIDPQKPSRLIVSSVDKWTGGDDVWLSENNGDSWVSKLLDGTLDLSFAPWKSVRTPHWIASVQIDPFDSTVAIFGTGYGVFRTKNLLDAKPVWAAADSNLEETVPLQLVVPSSGGAKLFSAMGDQGGFRHEQLDKAPQHVHLPDVGTSGSIDIACNKQSVLVKTHSSVNEAGTLGEISTDSGKTWTPFATNPPGVVIPSSANNWVGGGGTRSIGINADGSSIVWTAPNTSGAYYSKDNGATWTKSTSDIAIVATGATPFGDRVDPNKMYLMDTKSGIMFVSTDAGVSFKAGGSFNKLDDWETDNSQAVAVPGYEGHLLVASDHFWGGGGLYISTNSGITLKKVSNVGSATKVTVGKAAPGKTFPSVYIQGTVNNVYG